MRSYLDAVMAQPDNLAASGSAFRAALAGSAGRAALGALGGGRMAVLGMGASAAAALAFAATLRRVGRAAVAVGAADCVPGLADGYLAISQSGRSSETVEAIGLLERGRVALTNDPHSAVATAADVVLPLGSGADSRVSTLSYTATVQALGLLAEALHPELSTVDWTALPGLLTDLLDLEIEPVVDALVTAGCVDVIGGGARAGSAMAAALLLREAAHLPSAGYATREYLHGHLEIAGLGHAALMFGSGRELRPAADLARYGSAVVLITDAAGDIPAHPHLRVVRLPALPSAPGPAGRGRSPAGRGADAGLAGCVLDIVPVQLAARRIAQRKGLPIELRHMPDDTKVPGSGTGGRLPVEGQAAGR